MSAHTPARALLTALRAAVPEHVELTAGTESVGVCSHGRGIVWWHTEHGWECGDLLASEDGAVRATLRWLEAKS